MADRLSAEQLADVKEGFTTFATKYGDGSITMNEIGIVMRSHRTRLRPNSRTLLKKLMSLENAALMSTSGKPAQLASRYSLSYMKNLKCLPPNQVPPLFPRHNKRVEVVVQVVLLQFKNDYINGLGTINGYEIKHRSDLRNAKLAGTNLQCAKLQGADCTGADFSGCDRVTVC